ncbi:PGPGW domain-containing protein [Teredinibacter turnerae]|uniref:PGPGW domain-containing protein n=1 Tax=Teredinibacter turnerae TaxID=2426 RepID=UPI00037154A0|nr:PGPGW domain-containing protein [Teredinibacter turnerae]
MNTVQVGFLVSIAMVVLSLAALVTFIYTASADFFCEHVFKEAGNPGLSPLRIVKNLVGWCLVVAGIAMLVLPGQGLLTLLVGVGLCDFPGKLACNRWLLKKGYYHRAVRWLNQFRMKLDKPDFVLPDAPEDQ